MRQILLLTFCIKRLTSGRTRMTAADTTAAVDATIAVAAHLEAELEEALAEARLTRASFTVLDALNRAPERTLGQRELLGRLRRTAGTLSVPVGGPEEGGFVNGPG